MIFDDDPLDLFDDPEPPEEGVVCNRCDEPFLHWEEVRIEHNRKAWRLYNDDGELHNCPHGPTPEATADEFPAVQ